MLRINNTNQIYYEFELNIKNMDVILINIIKTIQALKRKITIATHDLSVMKTAR